ncbi:uncharacterized protein BYT42DRAFT_561565 [Radiomyces spectabilis]|uniref:uncharacterized protein n=1 Tax=Radiomyces spectabilis TaxID=64574 RepID=UPI00222087F7|nr:uncharacterized protein BYT42DRAFT_561565 [Radiomyces spectabilis]KAI8388869.1 hypothetical protein BYT42DRAFT_561565 [Radiomyces spectabilis]
MYRPPPGQFSPTPLGGAQTPGASPMAASWQRPSASPAGSDATASPGKGVWREHQTPEGRKYWFNTMTRQSTWQKPEELMTAEEKALLSCPWKEYTTPDGKKYYSNSQTKETVWEMPAEYKEHLEKAQQAQERAVVQPPPQPTPPVPSKPEVEKPRHVRNHPPPSVTLLAQEPAVEFATKEEAEKAFIKMLKETGVKSDWTWDQTMRAIITNPMYRSLKTLHERKAAFNSYIDREAKRERELREEKETKQRVTFFHMLENTKEIKPYSRYRSIARMLANNPAFTQVKSEKQRRLYIDEYVHGLQRREKDRLRELRKSSMERFAKLLKDMPEITFLTPWKEAQKLYMERPEFQDSKTFEGMDQLDFLSVYEEHNRSLWEAPMAEQNRKNCELRRRDRKCRDQFKALLQELLQKNLINSQSMWKEVYPHLKDDSRYLDLLGLPESTPLDLFWDLLDELDEQLYQHKKIIYDALKQAGFDVDVDTTYDAYRQVLANSKRITEYNVTDENMKIIFEHLQNKAAHRQKELRRKQEKKMRKRMDALRYAMKHLETAINVEDTWESVRPRLEQLPEFQDIEEEQYRIEAFDKYIKRLKEKQNEQDDEDEEGMIKEEDEIYDRRHRSRSRGGHRHSRHGGRRDSDVSDHGDSDEERSFRKRRKKDLFRETPLDQPIHVDQNNIEEGEALDEYVKDPRRQL